jgi:hypothetical protein
MTRLTIEYLLNGHRRGYNFTSATNGFDDQTLRVIWRNVMPRGQGWGSPIYNGARSLKCFPLPDERLAVADVTVTDIQDENGRKGIRQAVIDVMTPQVFRHHLHSRLDGYPQPVHTEAESRYRELSRQIPKLKSDQPLIMSREFHSPQDWWIVEALVLLLFIEPPHRLRSRSESMTFTTLALDYRGESQIVALPIEKAGAIDDLPVIVLDDFLS